MARPLTIACLQTRPMPDFETATTEALSLAGEAVAAGARLLLLPEYCGGLIASGAALAPPFCAEGDHPVLRALAGFAAEHAVWILVGSVAVSGTGSGAGEKFRNRGCLIDDTGTICGRYDKIHLFDIDLGGGESYCESATVEPGAQAAIYDTPFGRIGHTICYDLRFPQLFRHLAQAGAEILCCPAAFTQTTGEAHWHVLNRARAIENTSYIVSPCATGPVPGGGQTYGHSLIVDPWGVVLADGGTGPGVVLAHLDLDKVAEARAKIPSLLNDRDFGR